MSRERSRRRIWVIGIAMAVLAVPAALAFASHEGGFEDVPDSNIFHDDIQWMHDADVTRGCNPPENTEFCPTEFLTRQQEAAFFHRYDTYLRGSIEARLLPQECEAGQRAEFDGETWNCADTTTVDGGLDVAMGESFTIADGETVPDATATCAEGEVAIAGGVNPLDGTLEVTTSLDGATATMNVVKTGGDPLEVTPHAICASA